MTTLTRTESAVAYLGAVVVGVGLSQLLFGRVSWVGIAAGCVTAYVWERRR